MRLRAVKKLLDFRNFSRDHQKMVKIRVMAVMAEEAEDGNMHVERQHNDRELRYSH